MDFYVYLICRPDGTPCYVGKGRGRRLMRHKRASTNRHLSNIYALANGNLPIQKIADGLSESDAFALERETIKTIGREPNGPLVNLTDGGEGVSGLRFSTKSIIKLRESHKGQVPWNKNGTFTEETRRKMSEKKIGKPLSEDHRRRLSVGQSKRGPRSLELCAKISAGKMGKKATESTRAILRAANRSGDPEVRARIGAAVRFSITAKASAGITQWL